MRKIDANRKVRDWRRHILDCHKMSGNVSRFCGQLLSLDGGYLGRGFDSLTHEYFDAVPELGITLALHVAGGEGSIEPRCCFTLHRMLTVVKTIIAKDLGLGLIFGLDSGAPVHQAMRLIEVDGSGDIVGNDSIMLPKLGHAIDLHRQQNRDSSPVQFPRQEHHRSRSPAVPKKDDTRLGFLLFAEASVVVAVQQAEDGPVSLFAAAIFEYLDVSAAGSALPQALGQLHRPVMGVVVTYKSPRKANQNVIDFPGRLTRDGTFSRK